jgi:hypothetical protein
MRERMRVDAGAQIRLAEQISGKSGAGFFAIFVNNCRLSTISSAVM